MSAHASTPSHAAYADADSAAAAAAAAAAVMSPPHLLAADGLPATPALHAPLAFPYAHATPAVTPGGAGTLFAASPTPMTPGTLAPPMPGVHAQLSRLEIDALQLSRQYEAMIFSLQDSQKHMSAMTLHYVASLQQAVKSSSSSVGILIDTHTSLIRKMLIAVQQTEGIDTLETHIGATRTALSDLERSVEALLAEDALHATRQQLQQELHTPADVMDDVYHSSSDEADADADADVEADEQQQQRQQRPQSRHRHTPLDHEQPLSLSQPRTPRGSGHRTPTPQQPQLEAL